MSQQSAPFLRHMKTGEEGENKRSGMESRQGGDVGGPVGRLTDIINLGTLEMKDWLFTFDINGMS